MISLDGKWSLTYYPCGSKERDTIPCVVPGNIELALSDSGVVSKDLFLGKNIDELASFKAYDFEYERNFSLTKKQLSENYTIVFEGVDCIAEYYLNGESLGKSANMLVEHEFDLMGKLKEKNSIKVIICSAINETMK